MVPATVFSSSRSFAGEVEIVEASAKRHGDSWTFSVTLKHDDSGWDHYADLWQVMAPGGVLLGERELLHPHVDEQPFTRSLSGVQLPEDVTEVIIRARDSVHDFSPQEYRLALPE
ncbi:hypothetical protein QW131_09160 [Roseibium salinum]|nr:hypothetical protein [Roseibium salinum]